MKPMNLVLMLSVGLALVGCGSKTNPNVCCTDSANCAAQGLPDDAQCTDGLICRGNQCIAETCTSGSDCEAGAPFCTSSGLCAMTCDSDTECPGFDGDGKDMFCESGSCVECRDAADCTDPTLAICDAHACRGCNADSECSSGACGTDGVCVDAATLLYLDPTGFDGGTCTQAAPCRTIAFAFAKAVPNRFTLSMVPGNYVEAVDLQAAMTTATRFEVHGHGAVLSAPTGQDSSGFREEGGLTKFTIRELTLAHQPNTVVFGSPLELDDVTIQGAKVDAAAGLIANNVTVSEGDGIEISGQFTANGFTLTSSNSNMFTGLYIDPGASVNVTNLVVSGAQYQCVTLSDHTSGTIAFATVADCGLNLQSGPSAISCLGSTSVAFQSSIVWAPGSTYAPMSGCNFSQMIIGPPSVTGASSADPQFVNLNMHDLHLKSTSPAIDMRDAGPANDVAGTARPQGARFDLGAYEYKP